MSAEKLKRERIKALRQNLEGRATASPSSLTQAYGLAETVVRDVMREMGVQAS